MALASLGAVLHARPIQALEATALEPASLACGSLHEQVVALVQSAFPLMQQSGVSFWVESGTALGAYREHSVIQGDFDADVSIMHDQADAMRRVPWSSVGLVQYEGLGGFKVMQHDERCRDTRLDVFFNAMHGDGTLGYSFPHTPDGRPTFEFEREFYPDSRVSADVIFPLVNYTLDNLTVPGPAKMEAYLLQKYGDSFMVPKLASAQRIDQEGLYSRAIPLLTALPWHMVATACERLLKTTRCTHG